MKVDYLKLSEQYASFLVAIGGVTITVLALVLSFTSIKQPFLVAALVVATVSCFTGAHMMAETAAFISHSKGRFPQTGERLFLLSSINIFIAIVQLIFSLSLLPIASGKMQADEIKGIPASVFAFVIISALWWMVLSAGYRMPLPQKKWLPVIVSSIFSFVWALALYYLVTELLLQMIFITILIFTLASLLLFSWTFNDGGKVHRIDMWLCGLAITSTCASLVVAAIRS